MSTHFANWERFERQGDDMLTGKTGSPFFAEGVFNVSPHHMVRRPVRLIQRPTRETAGGK